VTEPVVSSPARPPKDPRDILIRPIISEKSYSLMDEGKYTFEIDPRANKTEVKIAVQEVFGVKVVSVNTINRAGKIRRTRVGLGKRKNTKRAIVTVAPGQTIDVFGGRAS
jgi:large subunit ribosomal protein L23